MFTVYCKRAIVPLLLRLALAAIFIFHGLQLVKGPETQWGSRWDTSPQAPPAAAQAAVAWGELVGGIALACGFLTRLAAVGIIIIMIGAIARVHWPHGFDLRQGGFEYNFALIMMGLCLVLGGPGPLALDRLLRLERDGTRETQGPEGPQIGGR